MKRATNSQKCIRVGEKHDDLDDDGKDGYHHTFLRDVGELVLLQKKKLSIIPGSCLLKSMELIPTDSMSFISGAIPPVDLVPIRRSRSQRAVDVPDDRILPGNMKDNFWGMGEQGPCCPCSVLHYDGIGGRNAAHLVNKKRGSKRSRNMDRRLHPVQQRGGQVFAIAAEQAYRYRYGFRVVGVSLAGQVVKL